MLQNSNENMLLNSSMQYLQSQMTSLVAEELQLLQEERKLQQSRNPKVNRHNQHRFTYYADKQLSHLVISQQFDFQCIANIMNEVFKYDGYTFTQTMCRQRWHQINRDRPISAQLKAKSKEEKTINAIMGISNPYSLYNTDELLETLDIKEAQRNQQSNPQKYLTVKQPQHQGYNIFKDSIRKIQDVQGYNQRFKQMKIALQKAQSPQSYIDDKPLLFSPEYEQLESFGVKSQELTSEKMLQIMRAQIQLSNLDTKFQQTEPKTELYHFQNHEKASFKSAFKKKSEDKVKLGKLAPDLDDMEQNWDDYESD